MRVELLFTHFIGNRLRYRGEILDWPVGTAVTLLMRPLDAEAATAVAAERFRVYARYVGPKWAPRLLDNPPKEFPFFFPPVPPIEDEGGPP